MRQRNVREARLEQNIFKDPAGHWWIRFAGDELKIGTRQGRVNEYKVNLTEYRPEFVPILEEWLQVHRPRLPGAVTSPFLFLTQSGRPFTGLGLRQELSYAVSMHTGQRFFRTSLGPFGLVSSWRRSRITQRRRPCWGIRSRWS